jgi:hypothetical protein
MAKTTKNKEEANLIESPRRLKAPTYKRGRYHKRIKHPGPKLKSGWKLFKGSTEVLWRNKRLFGGITVVYGLLSLILVRGFGSTAQLSLTKATLQTTKSGTLSTGFGLIGNLFGSSGGANQAGGLTSQSILLILVSLVIIWALRQVYGSDSKPVRVKSAFYNSTYALIPFILVLLVISLELVPLLVGGTIYTTVVSNGLAVGGLEQLAWSGVFFLAVLLSLYLLSSSLLGLYIVTLPNVVPLQALRSAKQLVQYRRWTVMRKILFLPLIILLLYIVLLLPVVLWLTPVAEWIFFVLGLLVLPVTHSYMYGLYRELL